MSLDHPLLQRKPWQGAPELVLGPGAGLRLSRLHEGCGPSRLAFAHLVGNRALKAAREAGDTQPQIYWIAPAWRRAPLFPEGMACFLDPGQVIFATPRRPEDVLWVLEEVLRSGQIPFAVAELDRPPPMTPVRRLHLAAETGTQEGRCAPIGLILTPGDGGAPGVESRWYTAPDHNRAAPDILSSRNRLWRLERRRARMAPPRAWALRHRHPLSLEDRDADGGFSLVPPLPAGQLVDELPEEEIRAREARYPIL